MVDLSVKIGRLTLKNPVMAASGTFGYGREFADLININLLGAIVTKTITLKPKKGNPPPRTTETPCGMLNAIGLANVGLEVFLAEKLPLLKKVKTGVIVSIAGEKPGDYKMLSECLSARKRVDGIEINMSCPNLGKKRLIAQDAKAAAAVIRAVRRATSQTLIAKLSPEVTDIVPIARACEKAGADAISLINAFPAMAIDIKTRRPKLANITGGLSGPAIKPIALRLVWQVARTVKIPLIGVGGIMEPEDALEFILAGASAVQIGCANFVDPGCTRRIISGIKNYLKKNRIKSVRALVGRLKI